jgi:DNA phosphorothioation-associated putative methyltransferase
VNLGYVINVIESQAERREALIKAWELTGQMLIVAAQVLIAQGNSQIAYGDGVITSRNTFQKYYDQEELKIYIDQVLGVDSVPAALGIYFVFRDEAQAQSFRASRFRSRVSVPKVQLANKRFEDYKELLTPLMAFFTERGRLPTLEELPETETLSTEFGNLRRAFQIVLQATNPQEWDAISDRRRQDLLVYLALSHFGRRPKLRDLTPVVQNDIKSLFGGYQQACAAAD